MENSKGLLEIKTKISNIKFLETKYAENLAYSKLFNILKNKNYKSFFSKKAKEFFLNNSFTSELKDGNLLMFKCFYKNKEMFILTNIIYSIKTSGGIVYFISDSSDVYICWTAHFFDRYNERMSLEIKNGIRRKTIKSFIVESITKNNIVSSFERGGTKTEFYSYCDNGLMCGESGDNIYLNKTFLSFEMLNENQRAIFYRLKIQSEDNVLFNKLINV